MPEYFLILAGIFLTTIFLQHYFHIKLYKSAKHFWTFNAINLVLAILWDQLAIARGHWSFSPHYLLGPRIGYMPIEEFLFVLVLSYFALTLFKIVEKKV